MWLFETREGSGANVGGGGENITDTPNMVFGGITVGLIPQSHGTWPNQATTRSRSAH